MKKPRKGMQSAAEIFTGMEEAKALVPTQTAPPRQAPIPNKSEFENRQLNLFQTFLSNTDEENQALSNAIELWDSLPRYSISRQQMTKLRIDGVFLKPHTAKFHHKGRVYSRTISPASVIDHDKKERFYYPSANEELVEYALRKLAIEKQAGYFDKPNYRSGVLFTLYELREEMKKRGHARSYQQLVESLNILNKANIDIIPQDGTGTIKSSALPVLVAVSRKDFASDPKSRWMVQFHPLVTDSIDKLTYRQFNYHLMMGHSLQLSRWIHQQLVLKYTFANLMNPFELHYTTVKRDSGLLDAYKRERAAIETLESAFEELIKSGVIIGADRRDILGERRKLLDVVFSIRPSLEFVRETKAANRRTTNSAASSTSFPHPPKTR